MKIKTTSQILQLVSSQPNKDALLYFIHLILKRNTNKDVFLYSQILKKTFGDRNYKSIINQLIEIGIIERLTNYRDKEYAYYTYKIKFPHSKKELINYEINDKKLIRRVEYIIENNYEKLTPELKQVLRNIETLAITPELLSELKKDGVELEDEVFLTNNSLFKPRINQSKSGRVHHTLTNLNKRYRKKLTSTCGNLVEIDTKNAQLIFLSQLCPKDSIFNDDAFGGVFYNRLADKMGVDISDKSYKDEFKSKFFKTILCNENKAVVANNKYTKAFKKLYPEMFDYLIYLNQDSTKANKLQEMESEFFITNILRDLVESKLFAIPIHDAMIVLEKDIDIVMSIINEHSMAFFNRYIPISIERYTICSTPFETALHIKEEERTREDNNKCISSANNKGIEQNKNHIKSQETIDKISIAILKLKEEGLKITTRKIQAISGVSTASVNKHYKAIIASLSDEAIEATSSSFDNQIIKPEATNEIKILMCQPKTILNEFQVLSDTYNFPRDISEVFVNHINTVGFDSVEEMMEEIYSHPILKDLLNSKQAA